MHTVGMSASDSTNDPCRSCGSFADEHEDPDFCDGYQPLSVPGCVQALDAAPAGVICERLSGRRDTVFCHPSVCPLALGTGQGGAA